MTRQDKCAALLSFGLLVSCGSAQRDPTVLVETEQHQDTGPRLLIEERIAADERKAAAILAKTVSSEDPQIAGWAAVHALRLGIEIDAGAAHSALVEATRNRDDLLRALAWRWLAAAPPSISLPPLPGANENEPVTLTAEESVFAALAFAARGDSGALAGLGAGAIDCAPELIPKEATEQRVEELLTLAQPYAKLELALATAFAEARRDCRVEVSPGGGRRPVAARLFSELLSVMAITPEAPAAGPVMPRTLPRENLAGRLTNPLALRGRRTVISAAVTAPDPELRVMALDALCSLALEPVAGDFGAAAAALEAPALRVALAGARTFLLLVTRARR